MKADTSETETNATQKNEMERGKHLVGVGIEIYSRLHMQTIFNDLYFVVIQMTFSLLLVKSETTCDSNFFQCWLKVKTIEIRK